MGAQLVALTSETQRYWAEKELAAPGTLVVGDTNGDLKRWFDVHGVGGCSDAPTASSPPLAWRSRPQGPARRYRGDEFNGRGQNLMSLALVTMSHSPLLGFNEAPAEVEEAVQSAFSHARAFVADYDPELVVVFAPDHYNGFFYDLMPPFCIGFDAVAVGDYDTEAGPLDDSGSDRRGPRAARHRRRPFDTAISRRMELDHGAVQPLEILLGDIAGRPVVPIFVNGVARPFVPMSRIRAPGQAVGDFFAQRDERTLLVGSGGLSHDPPVPQWSTADDGSRAALLSGRNPTPEAQAAPASSESSIPLGPSPARPGRDSGTSTRTGTPSSCGSAARATSGRSTLTGPSR